MKSLRDAIADLRTSLIIGADLGANLQALDQVEEIAFPSKSFVAQVNTIETPNNLIARVFNDINQIISPEFEVVDEKVLFVIGRESWYADFRDFSGLTAFRKIQNTQDVTVDFAVVFKGPSTFLTFSQSDGVKFEDLNNCWRFQCSEDWPLSKQLRARQSLKLFWELLK